MRHALSARERVALDSLTATRNFRQLAWMISNDLDKYCEREAFHRIIVYGARSPAIQLGLFRKGRKFEDGQWRIIGDIVTRALPTQSPHCYAAAVDVALVWDETGEWLPDNSPEWETVCTTAERHGCSSGHRWPSKVLRDSAHVEIGGWQALVKAGTLRLVA